jgi:outer membrane protein TolC
MVCVNSDIKHKKVSLCILSISLFLCLISNLSYSENGDIKIYEANSGEVSSQLPLPEVLDLETAQKIALEQNPSLKAVTQRIEQAHQQVKQALAQYYPEITASYMASHTELSDSSIRRSQKAIWEQSASSISQSILRGGSTTGTGTNILSSVPWDTSISSMISAYQASSNVPESQDNYALNFIVRYTLFDGFARKYSLAMSQLIEVSTKESQKEAIRLLLLSVANSFYAVQLAEENLRIAEADKAFNERQLYEARVKQEMGAGSLSDVLNFEVGLRSAEAQIISARQNREIARIALAGVMGLPSSFLPEHVELVSLKYETEEDLKKPGVDELLAMALQNSPDLQMLNFSIQHSEKELGIARSSLYPQMGVSLSRSATRSVDSEFSSDDFGTTVSFDVSIIFFLRVDRAKEQKHVQDLENQNKIIMQGEFLLLQMSRV